MGQERAGAEWQSSNNSRYNAAECRKMLRRRNVLLFIIVQMHYNPFHYIRSEKDILKLVNTIIANTKGDGEKSGEDFWVKAERLLYCALIGYISYIKIWWKRG